MCGIAGFCSKTIDNKQVILSMCEKMLHRGPDAGDYYVDDNTGITLGHRRLAIVDLTETGAQPMTSHNGRYVMVYNGEIYNCQEIREKLIQGGYVEQFRGTSDTEVLLESIVAFGMDRTLSMATGMFAIAVYDKDTKDIVLTRDRVGEKPLYYGHVNDTFVFCSDVGMLQVVPGFQKIINKKAVEQFLRYGYVPTPFSIYENIFKCQPGTYLTAKYPYDTFKETVYYDLAGEYVAGKEHPFQGDFQDAMDALHDTLKQAVKSQMMADVPLGAFLSGGIDSATVVALMQAQSSEQIKTFTIGFEEKKYNEADDAAAIAKYLNTDHTCLMLTEKELLDVVPKIPTIFTEPFADSSQIPTYLVSKLAKSRVTVSLSGDAGDELFCGYNTYWKCANLYHKLEKLPVSMRNAAGVMLDFAPLNHNNTIYRGAHCLKAKDIAGVHESVCYDTTYLGDMLVTNQGKRPVPKIQNGSLLQIEDEMMLRDMLQYHADDILVKVDRAGMAVSLENRVPMLDKNVLKLAFSLPVEYKLGNLRQSQPLISKYVLKEVLYRYVPKEIMDRPKKGFSVPLMRWLQSGIVHDMAEELLTSSCLVRDSILDGKAVSLLWEHFKKTGQNKGLVWNVFVLEQWYRSTLQ